MSRSSRSPAAVALASALVVALAGCGGGPSGAATTPTVDPTAAQLQTQLDDLPAVDGATRTVHRLQGATLTETFTVPPGTPACLQLLSRLDAGGYQVVTGAGGTPVAPGTCRTAAGDAGVDTTSGTATILARGGSEIALGWTATSYTVAVTAS